MKVGIFDPYLDSISGGERYMLTIAACLAKEHTVSVFWDDKNILQKAEKKLGLPLAGVSVVPNIFNLRSSGIQKLTETAQYDLLLVLSDGSIPLVFSKKLILHFQHPMQHVNLNLIDRLKLSRVNGVICNSSFTKSFIDKTYQVKSKVLYPPVPLQSAKIQKKEQLILTVGRFSILPDRSDFKKHGELIEAFKKVYKKNKSWKFVVVTSFLEGDQKYLAGLQEKAKGFPIEILVSPSNSVLASLYEKASIYWHAAGYGEDLRKHPERAEHFGISTVEAMSAKAVPVVINAGGQKEIVKDAENGFLWDSIEELVKKTEILIKKKKVWEELSVSAHKSAQKFSEAAFCKKLSSIIETV